MNQAKPQLSSYESRVWTSNLRLARWTGLWLVTTALMAFGPKFLWNKGVVLTLLAVALNVGAGVGWMVATKDYIAGLDELQRRVHLNALAIAAGVAVIVGIPYSMMDAYNVIPFQAQIGHLVGLMGVTFVVAYLYGAVRVR
jgi:hypothetical protein